MGCWEIRNVTNDQCVAYAVHKERLWVEKGTLAAMLKSHGAYANFAVVCADGKLHKQILDPATADYSGIR
jgi:hypothetical protein